jgi:hypothetical protein
VLEEPLVVVARVGGKVLIGEAQAPLGPRILGSVRGVFWRLRAGAG